MRKLIVALLTRGLAMGLGYVPTQDDAQTAKPAVRKKKGKRARAGKHRMRGSALWYGGARFNGRTIAGNEILDETKMTAAHRTLPFGTVVRVTNLRNNKSAVVTINDRMALRRTVIIDVTRGVASELDVLNSGRVPVRLEIVC